MSDFSCQDLVQRAQQEDEEALGALYDIHYHSVLRYFWARIGDLHAAEDLTGDVFRRMLTALPGYKNFGIPFRVWLFKIAHNVLIDYYRQENAMQIVSLETPELEKKHMGNDDPDFIVSHKMAMEQLFHSLTTLEPLQQEVLTLRFLAGLSLNETSLSVGKTTDAVKAIQRRSLKILRLNLTYDQR